MQNKILTTLFIGFISVGFANGVQEKKISEGKLTIERKATYQMLQKNYGNLDHCTVRRGEARGTTLFFPEGRSDIMVMYDGGIYFAIKIENKKVKLLWSLCDGKNGKSLKKSQHKSLLWKDISDSYKEGVQRGEFPHIEGGYDMFDAYMETGTATRIDKYGKVVCECENTVAEQGFWVKPKVTKLCKP